MSKETLVQYKTWHKRSGDDPEEKCQYASCFVGVNSIKNEVEIVLDRGGKLRDFYISIPFHVMKEVYEVMKCYFGDE